MALVGRNGAGKSTIVKLLGRLYDPDEGVILIDGRDVREYDPVELRREFGVMFQDYAAYQVSAGENIGVGNVDHADRSDGDRQGRRARRRGRRDRASSPRATTRPSANSSKGATSSPAASGRRSPWPAPSCATPRS